jgi:hypothetical protein
MSFSAGPRWNAPSPRWANAHNAEALSHTSSWSAAVLPWPWRTRPLALLATLTQRSSPRGSDRGGRRVADDLGLPYWWLNEQASIYISGTNDPGKRRVFDHPGLRVAAASPAHIFAMKAFAARMRDIDDLRLLADTIEAGSADEALQICTDFFPDEPVPQRSVAVLRELFGLALPPEAQVFAAAVGRRSPTSLVRKDAMTKA